VLGSESPFERVLLDLAVLHDDLEILLRIFKDSWCSNAPTKVGQTLGLRLEPKAEIDGGSPRQIESLETRQCQAFVEFVVVELRDSTATRRTLPRKQNSMHLQCRTRLMFLSDPPEAFWFILASFFSFPKLQLGNVVSGSSSFR